MQSTQNLSPREKREAFSADLSRRFWVRGSGRAFWENAARHARPGQLRTVLARMSQARNSNSNAAGALKAAGAHN